MIILSNDTNSKWRGKRNVRSPEERFWAKVRKTHTCWLWLGHLDKDGYGNIRVGLHRIMAHRFSYKLYYSFIDPNLTINHLCENKSCVNPTHLELISLKGNLMYSDTPAKRNSEKIFCNRGHLLSGYNLYLPKNGSRQCKRCKTLIMQRIRLKKRLTNAC